ncbi:MAG: hypothetical protein QOJ66_2742 [Ilumatobacteraceae bacterium]|jgi:hypothetical protein
MRRILALFAIAAVGVVATGTVAQAQVVENDTILLVGFNVFVPCANGGAGEVIAGDLQLHVLVTTTVNGNNVSGKDHFQPQGGSLVGQTTGDTYVATGATQDSFTGSFQNGRSTFTFVNNFRMIGPGPGNNFLVHETFHITVNANGVTTVTHDNLTVDCK